MHAPSNTHFAEIKISILYHRLPTLNSLVEGKIILSTFASSIKLGVALSSIAKPEIFRHIFVLRFIPTSYLTSFLFIFSFFPLLLLPFLLKLLKIFLFIILMSKLFQWVRVIVGHRNLISKLDLSPIIRTLIYLPLNIGILFCHCQGGCSIICPTYITHFQIVFLSSV